MMALADAQRTRNRWLALLAVLLVVIAVLLLRRGRRARMKR
jgi:hypothetical protein